MTPEQQQVLSELAMDLTMYGAQIHSQPISYAFRAPVLVYIQFPNIEPQTRLILASGRVL